VQAHRNTPMACAAMLGGSFALSVVMSAITHP
jgi:hypothetical protein